MNASNGVRWSRRPLVLLALLALVGSCECDETLAAICNGRLQLSFSGFPYYVGDEADVSASLTGDTNGCPSIADLNLNWTYSNNLSLVQSFGDRARFRGLGAGAAYASARATNGLDLSARVDWDITRITGDVDVNVTIPDNGVVDYRIFGNGFDQQYTGSTVIQDLDEGLYNYEAVEVLRGPQGALYGANTATGTFNITRNMVTSLPIEYTLQNSLVEVGFNLPAGVPGPYGRITGSGGFEYTFTQLQGTYGFDAGNYVIETFDADPLGYKFAPSTRTESLNLSAGVSYTREYDFSAQYGKVTISTTGVPAGTQDNAVLTDPQGSPWNIMLPYTGFVAPGDWEVESTEAVYPDADNDEYRYFTPRVSALQFAVTAGLDVAVQYEYDHTSTRTDWQTTFMIKLDPWGHGPFVNMPVNMVLEVYEDEVNAGGIRVEGDDPFATVLGTIGTNGDVNGEGAGDVAGYTDVPYYLTANIDWSAGLFTGDLEVGRNTPPLSLPNGAIIYALTGTRITF